MNNLTTTTRLNSPYTPKANVYKGMNHAHTTGSDGQVSPTDAVTYYQDKGYDWITLTDHNTNTPDPEVDGILFIPGLEYGSSEHITRTNIQSEATYWESTQLALSRGYNEGNFVVIAHPGYGSTLSKCLSYQDFDAIEVWNTLISYWDGWTGLFEEFIDPMLSSGQRFNLVAVDDNHFYWQDRFGLGGLYVYADNLTLTDIMANLKAGNFYASNNTISDLTISATELDVTVTVGDDSTIEFIVKDGVIAKTTSQTKTSTYTATEDDLYVRARVVRDSDSGMAWTNPIYVEDAPTPKYISGAGFVERGHGWI